MRIALFDIEADGLLDTVSKIHCAWIINPNNTDQKRGYKPEEIDLFVKHLNTFDCIVGHNIIGYDIPALLKLGYNLNKELRVFDTLVASKLLFNQTIHSMKSWGEKLGVLKGDFGDDGVEQWERFTSEMFDYCEQDVIVNSAIYQHFCEVAKLDQLAPPNSLLKFE